MPSTALLPTAYQEWQLATLREDYRCKNRRTALEAHTPLLTRPGDSKRRFFARFDVLTRATLARAPRSCLPHRSAMGACLTDWGACAMPWRRESANVRQRLCSGPAHLGTKCRSRNAATPSRRSGELIAGASRAAGALGQVSNGESGGLDERSPPVPFRSQKISLRASCT